LEVSRQRLRPSLNESYDIEHVLVRGPRSLGQSILRIVGEDAAKENTGEIQVYVPADVASYLLNEKRYDIVSIEKTNNIKVLIIADPYKSRPYYKVVRIKKSEVKHINSYSLTPNSPEPDTNWRDNKNISTSIKPLVDGVKPPKMPKKRKDGIVKWLKTITGIEVDDKKTTKKKPRRNVRKKNTSPRKNTNQKKGFQPKKKPNKNFKNDKKEVKKPQSKSTPKPSAKKPINKKSSNVKKNQGMPNKNNVKVEAETPKAKSAIKEIVKKKKVKKELPLRAKNDPRQKN
jgi:ribonuclease E